MADGYQSAARPKYESNSKPPRVVDVLQAILARRRFKSKQMPHNDFEAAHWWVRQQEKPDEDSDKPQPIEKEGVIIGWQTPYHDRLASTLRKFLVLSEPQKAYVIEGIESGVPWRGEDIRLYRSIRHEHGVMMQDPARYVAEAGKAFSKLGGVLVEPEEKSK